MCMIGCRSCCPGWCPPWPARPLVWTGREPPRASQRLSVVSVSYFSPIKSQNRRYQGLSYYFCLMVEGPGSVPMTNEPGCGSGRPKAKTYRSGSATLLVTLHSCFKIPRSCCHSEYLQQSDSFSISLGNHSTNLLQKPCRFYSSFSECFYSSFSEFCGTWSVFVWFITTFSIAERLMFSVSLFTSWKIVSSKDAFFPAKWTYVKKISLQSLGLVCIIHWASSISSQKERKLSSSGMKRGIQETNNVQIQADPDPDVS